MGLWVTAPVTRHIVLSTCNAVLYQRVHKNRGTYLLSIIVYGVKKKINETFGFYGTRTYDP